MSPDDVDRLWAWAGLALLVVAAVLGISGLLDLDDANLRYPEPAYDPVPAYVHPEEEHRP